MSDPSIPTEQWAQVIEKFDQLPVYKKIPVKKPGPDEILINIKYSGVCHSDVHAMKGDWPRQPEPPLVGGHEGAGIVVAKGELVKELEVGDYTGIKWINGTCNICSFCQGGTEELCFDATLSGYTVDGSFQQYAIAKAAAATKVPKDVDLAAISPVMCAGLTVYKGLKVSGARAGQYVAIVGAGGGLGSFAVQYAKAMAFVPIAIDSGEQKKKSALEHGAAAFVDFKASSDVIRDLRQITPDGLGPHAAIIVSSEEEPFSHASEYVRPLGTVVIVGIPADAYVKSQLWDMVARDVTIKGTLVGNRLDLAEALEFFRRGLINVPYEVVPMSQLNKTLEQLDHNQVIGRYVIDPSK